MSVLRTDPADLPISRPRAPLGASCGPEGTLFALWSTRTTRASVRLFDAAGRPLETRALRAVGEGRFEATLPGVGPGALYKFVLDDHELPDPYARALPFGVHGPARVEAPRAARALSPPRPLGSWVLYELHVGAFTPEGTYRAAAARLPYLAELGVTAIELMPLAAFDGGWGWGYDGVAHYAPFAPYGEPDDLRAFVEAAHALGLSVVLDVVYNHFGPSGSYLGAYAPEYFTSRSRTPWGDGPDFANPYVRAYVIDNARYWLEGFGFDGLRLDATHQIHDPSPVHVLGELAALAAGLTPPRALFAEDDRNDPRLVTDAGLAGLWADDFHHAARVRLTGERDGYYAAYEPSVEVLARTINRGWLYEGQPFPTTGEARGLPADALGAEQLVYCLQNHDQVGNRALGDRLHEGAGMDAYAAVSMLLLYLPMMPLLFMGQEWAASTPFLYFTDHEPELGLTITEGRRREFAAFAAFSEDAARAALPDPQAPATFARSKLHWDERARPPHARILALYRAMLTLRREDPVLSLPARERLRAEARGGVLYVKRWRNEQVRWLIVNLESSDLALGEVWQGAEPVLSSAPGGDGARLVVPAKGALLLRGAGPAALPEP